MDYTNEIKRVLKSALSLDNKRCEELRRALEEVQFWAEDYGSEEFDQYLWEARKAVTDFGSALCQALDVIESKAADDYNDRCSRRA